MRSSIFGPLLHPADRREMQVGVVVDIDPQYGRALVRLPGSLTVWTGVLGELQVAAGMRVMVAHVEGQWIVVGILTDTDDQNIGLAVI